MFKVPALITLIVLSGAWWLGGPSTMVITALLALMEISLSFDNAIVNSKTLQSMPPVWQHRFLTWGMLVAVFGMRLFFPMYIVSIATGEGLVEVGRMAVHAPTQYAEHIKNAHIYIASFGGVFLLMVFLKYLIDDTKDVHWIGPIERRLAKLGRVEALEVVLVVLALLSAMPWLSEMDRMAYTTGGLVGLVVYLGMEILSSVLELDTPFKTGILSFIYLEILDMSFSLDGVVGAFAMSNNIWVIMAGLGVGAMFIRSVTVSLVKKGTLTEFIYLEHGAHYGIGALAAIMLTSMWIHIPDVITGSVGVAMIGAALISSLRHTQREKRAARIRVVPRYSVDDNYFPW